MTSTLGAFGVMVEDRAKKISRDFSVSPLRRGDIAGGYILCSVCVGIIMSLVALVIGELYIVAAGGELLPMENMLQVIGGIFLSVFSSSSIVLFIVSFFKSQNAFGTASTIIGTLIGFLTGVYIPIGSLPDAVQAVSYTHLLVSRGGRPETRRIFLHPWRFLLLGCGKRSDVYKRQRVSKRPQ